MFLWLVAQMTAIIKTLTVWLNVKTAIDLSEITKRKINSWVKFWPEKNDKKPHVPLNENLKMAFKRRYTVKNLFRDSEWTIACKCTSMRCTWQVENDVICFPCPKANSILKPSFFSIKRDYRPGWNKKKRILFVWYSL